MTREKRSATAAARWSEYVKARYRESGAKTYSAFAKMIDVQHRTLIRWIDEGNEPSPSLVERFARRTGRPEPEVRAAAGLGAAISSEPPRQVEPEDSATAGRLNPLPREVIRMHATPVRFIPVARGAVSAGRHEFSLTDDAVPVGVDEHPYRELVAVIVVGSCMEPEISPGEYVFVDVSRTEALAGELVVVLTDDGEVMVKRVERSTGGLILVDNRGGRFRPSEAMIRGIVVGGSWKSRRRA